jgi:short-subunit dehydrogenase
MSRVVIITGASRGIGAEIAKSLAADGGALVLAARDERGLETTAAAVRSAGARAVPVVADMAIQADRERLIGIAEAEGPVEVLINNAGVETPVPVVEQTLDEIEMQLRVNLHAPIMLTRLMLPKMMRRSRGCIVMVSSMSGKSATPFNAVYASTKYGLNGFVGSLRFELEGTGVHVGAVCPGFVSGGMWADGGVKAPALLREVSIGKVVKGVRKVMAGSQEVLVTPGPVRPLLALSQLAPSLTGPVLRGLGVLDALKKRAQVVQQRRANVK